LGALTLTPVTFFVSALKFTYFSPNRGEVVVDNAFFRFSLRRSIHLEGIIAQSRNLSEIAPYFGTDFFALPNFVEGTPSKLNTH